MALSSLSLPDGNGQHLNHTSRPSSFKDISLDSCLWHSRGSGVSLESSLCAPASKLIKYFCNTSHNQQSRESNGSPTSS
ncbi:hypothetical protein AOLI_G00112330 [Acnodon oligacanthus]